MIRACRDPLDVVEPDNLDRRVLPLIGTPTPDLAVMIRPPSPNCSISLQRQEMLMSGSNRHDLIDGYLIDTRPELHDFAIRPENDTPLTTRGDCHNIMDAHTVYHGWYQLWR
jgi:hypothetical protein